jgi:hypothetical protein
MTHVNLLCIQKNAKDRPSMLEISSILNNETVALITPEKAKFLKENR